MPLPDLMTWSLLALCLAAYAIAALPALMTRHPAIALGAVALHAGLLIPTLLGGDGVRLGFGLASSLIGWQCATLLAVLALREPVRALASVVFPVAAATAVMGVLMPSTAPPLHGGAAVASHVLISILGYGLLTLACLQAGLVWLSDARLRRPGSAAPRALPPLQTQERLLFLLIAVGFVLLSLSLATGLIVANDLQTQHLSHKTVFTAIAWLVFGALLLGRWRAGWRGRTAVRWTMAGYASLVLAYFGSKLVLELLLGESWS